jgi:hypothetical protein
MTEFIALSIGVVIYIALMWLLLAVIRMTKTPNEQELDDMEQIAAVSKPAPLDSDLVDQAYIHREVRRVRAGS